MTGIRGRQRSGNDSGAVPLIGVILLFGMVIAGVAVVLVAGSTMVDTLEAEADREKVQLCVDETDHRLGTVASTGHEQSMEFDDAKCQPETADTGEITVTWYDDSDPPEPTDPADWDDSDDDTATEELGALEFELDDRTIAHQGGGVWELTGSGARVEKPPAIGFDDDESLQLSLMSIGRDAGSGGVTKAYHDAEDAVEMTENLREVAENPDGDHFAIRIESEYAEGWEQHFDDEADDVTTRNVDVERSGDTVVLRVEDLGEATSPHFLIEDNRGLSDQHGDPIEDNFVETGDKFAINATLTNNGEEESGVTATVSVWNASGDKLVEERGIASDADDLGEGDSVDLDESDDWVGGSDHTFNPNSGSNELTPGHKYEYNIETAPGGDTLENNETFYFLHDDPHYTVVDVNNEPSSDEITLSAEIENIGTDDGGAENVTLEIRNPDGGDPVTSTAEIQLEEMNRGEVSWTIDQAEWPKGEYAFTVTTEHDSDGKDGAFTVTEGGAFEISEDLGIPDERQLNGTDGQVITDEQPITISVNITSTYDDERSKNVTLDVFDRYGNAETSAERNVTIGGGETKRINLTASTLEAGELYEYNVSTETDDLDTLGSFLVAEEPAEFTIETVAPGDEPATLGESLEFEVDVANQDGRGDEQFVWLEDFDGSVVSVAEIQLDGGDEGQVTLEWGSVDAPESADDTNVTVRTVADTATTDVEIEPRLEIADVDVRADSVAQERPVNVDVELRAVGGTAEQEVVLEGDYDKTTEWVSVSPGERETVTLEHLASWRTERVTVSTDDDEADEVVVVERDEPDCRWVEEPQRDEDGYLLIENVDQLQCIDSPYPNNEHYNRADSLRDDYRLADDIDAHGTEYWNSGNGFEPIGDQHRGGHEFAGDFDGNGHAIRGLHIARPDEDFVGLFAVNTYFDETGDHGPFVGEGSKIHNLRLENVSVHGRQVTGGLIGAAGGVIENVRVSGTVEAEYQEVGGIAGSAHNADLDNRLVSEATVRGGLPAAATEEVNHPWWANNLGIGGIVGSTGWYTEVSTAYSQADVEGPFGVGGIVGWTSDYASTNEQMYWAEGEITITADQYPNDPDTYLDRMDRDSHGTNTGGAIFGRGDDDGDEFDDSVYYNNDHHDHPFGEHVIGDWIDVNERTTDEMQGLEATEYGNLGHLDYEDEGGPWVALPDDYPRFAWELAAEGRFDVEIDDAEDVTAGEAAEINVTVTSRYRERGDSSVTQTVSLVDPDGRTVDTQSVTLPSSLEEDASEQITLVWQTDTADNGTAEVTVRSEDMEDSTTIEIEPAAYGPGASNGPGLGPEPDEGGFDDKGDVDPTPGAADGSSSGAPDADPDIDVDVDVIEIN